MEIKKVLDARGNIIKAFISDKDCEKHIQFFSKFFYSTDGLIVIKNDGFNIVEPIMCLERWDGFKRMTMYITEEYTSGNFKSYTVDNYLREKKKMDLEYDLKEKYIDMVCRLINKGYTHRDLAVHNFLMGEKDLSIVDVDGIKKDAFFKRWCIMRTLNKLYHKLWGDEREKEEILLEIIKRCSLTRVYLVWAKIYFRFRGMEDRIKGR